MIIGSKIYEVGETGSTNSYLSDLLEREVLPDGTAVVAAFQTHGRGLGRNTWFSDAGKNLLLSFVIYPSYLDPTDQSLITRFTALGIYDLVSSKLNVSVRVKWPNDIMANDRKIAGILIQNSVAGEYMVHSVIGVGINVNQEAFPDDLPDAVSIKMISSSETDLTLFRKDLFNSLNRRLRQMATSPGELTNDYLSVLYRFGEKAGYRIRGNEVSAHISGIDRYGRLLLTDDQGSEHVCDLKEVEYL